MLTRLSTPLYQSLISIAVILLLSSGSLMAQQSPQMGEAEAVATPLILTLEDALSIALSQNYDIRDAELQVADAEAQIREAWGQVYPQLDASSMYTRDVVSANPFAGSDALDFFTGGGMSDWVAFNERARTDNDSNTSPIPYEEFVQQQEQAREQAGIRPGGAGNPFGVDNQFSAGVSLSQTLYDASAFAAIRGARQLREINERGLRREEQLLVQDVKDAYYSALLAQQQTTVASESVRRTQETLREVGLRVERGVVPAFDRLSTEVELANLETEFVQSGTQRARAVDQLKMLLGLPMYQDLLLEGDLEAVDHNAFQQVSFDDAISQAIRGRPDLRQTQLAIELQEIDRNITRARYFPTISAFASFDYLGNVPDNRTRTITDPMDPFFFDTQERDFFDSSYWNADVNAGLQLSWTIFDGFQRESALEQREIAINQAEIDRERMQQVVYMEVQQALREMEAAQQRIFSQERNVEQAETNFRYATQRVNEGVSTQLELRDASQQLDQSRLNYYQAVHDYLVARSAFETAIGAPLENPELLQADR